MNLARQAATILLTEEGREVIKLSGIASLESHLIPVLIQESEDLGLWLRFEQEDSAHLLLLLWQFILAIDMEEGLGKITGLKG
jgi:hypothetical protein